MGMESCETFAESKHRELVKEQVVVIQRAINAASESILKLDALRRVDPGLLRKPINLGG